jgi:hypothetical protein
VAGPVQPRATGEAGRCSLAVFWPGQAQAPGRYRTVNYLTGSVSQSPGFPLGHLNFKGGGDPITLVVPVAVPSVWTRSDPRQGNLFMAASRPRICNTSTCNEEWGKGYLWIVSVCPRVAQ